MERATQPVSLNRLAARATTHCLTGCAIGEVLGMVIGTALGWSAFWTIVMAVALAFVFGYSLTLWPLVASGITLRAAVGLAFVADTLSITVMFERNAWSEAAADENAEENAEEGAHASSSTGAAILSHARPYRRLPSRQAPDCRLRLCARADEPVVQTEEDEGRRPLPDEQRPVVPVRELERGRDADRRQGRPIPGLFRNVVGHSKVFALGAFALCLRHLVHR